MGSSGLLSSNESCGKRFRASLVGLHVMSCDHAWHNAYGTYITYIYVRVKQLATLYSIIQLKVKGEAQVESEVQVKRNTRSGKLPYKGVNPG